MDTTDNIRIMLQRENVIWPRPDRTVTLIRELYRFSIKKVCRKSDMKDKRLSRKTDERNISTLKSPAITI